MCGQDVTPRLCTIGAIRVFNASISKQAFLIDASMILLVNLIGVTDVDASTEADVTSSSEADMSTEANVSSDAGDDTGNKVQRPSGSPCIDGKSLQELISQGKQLQAASDELAALAIDGGSAGSGEFHRETHGSPIAFHLLEGYNH